jgi:hypothetical protein
VIKVIEFHKNGNFCLFSGGKKVAGIVLAVKRTVREFS